MSKEDIKLLNDLINKYDIKKITITETKAKTKTLFIDYEN